MAPPPYRQFQYPGFGGGLNLRDNPDRVPPDQAVDALNVLHLTRGSAHTRKGYGKFTAAESANDRYDSLTAFYKSDGTKQLVAGAGDFLEALDAAGTVIASDNTHTASPHFFQRFGGPTAEHVYIANGVDTVSRWTGAAFETPAYSGVTPTGKFLGLSSTDNRLVVARFSGNTAGDNPSTVRFSDEGDPTTFQADNYVDLTPGDGEEIMGVASWRDLVIVFKQTKFFVFYGNSVDDDGAPVFNYRPVVAAAGLAASRALAVSEHGVYFLDRTGVYFTNGNHPVQVGEPVEPIFHGGSSVYYQGGELNDSVIGEATMVYHDERVWLSFPAGASTTNNRNLVFDPQEKWWALCDLPAGPMAVFRADNVDELLFGYASGAKHIGRHIPDGESAYSADDVNKDGTGGTAINARWRGGWFNYDSPVVKTLRELKLAGVGLVTVSIYRDFRQTAAQSQQVELSPPDAIYDTGLLYDDGELYGPSSIVTPKAVRRAVRGEVFSIGFSNSELNRNFKIHRLTTHLREARIPTVVKVN